MADAALSLHDIAAPLSDAERQASGSARQPDPADQWSPIVPVPDDAPQLKVTLGGCAPDAVWSYRLAGGLLAGYACRWNKGEGKDFRFATFGEDGRGVRRWALKHLPVPRPLYNSDRLAADPGGPVIVTEGEKSADAAARIFPGSVTTTSPGGANAANMTDWRLLAGRRVLILPDADEPGGRYRDDVARLAFEAAAASVAVIDARALAATVPDDRRTHDLEGYDVADLLDDGVSPDEARKRINGMRKAIDGAQFAGRPEPDGPLPLFPPLPPAEPYPIEALGPVLSRAARAIARKVQVPEAIAAQSVLTTASLAAQAHADVQMPFGQSRPLSIFAITIAGSGDRKSTADNEACWPVAKREKSLREQHAEEMKTWRIAHAAWSAEKKKIEAAKCDYAERRSRLEDHGEEPEKPLAPCLISGDMTIEGLTKNWPTMHAALGLFTAEGGQFTAGHGMSDDNRLKTAAMLSEVWDGKPIKRLRALDGVSILPGRRLAMHLMVQPDAAASFLSNGTLRDQGLLSRVLVAAPESISGTRLYRDTLPEDEVAIRAYGARLLSILEACAPLAGGARNELEPPALPLSTEAETAWRQFFNHIEAQSGPGRELWPIRDFAAKAAEHAARIAGVLTVIDGDLRAEEIGFSAMASGIALADWYVTEALRLQGGALTDPRLLRAKELLDWLQELGEPEISFRQILQFGPGRVRTMAAANEALGILESHRWLEEISKRPRRFRLISTSEVQS